jgi:hypothetical protein
MKSLVLLVLHGLYVHRIHQRSHPLTHAVCVDVLLPFIFEFRQIARPLIRTNHLGLLVSLPIR